MTWGDIRLWWAMNRWRLRPWMNFARLAGRVDGLLGQNERMTGQIVSLRMREQSLQREIGRLKSLSPRHRLSGNHEVALGEPEFTIMGVSKPDGSKRMYASRDLGKVSFGMTDIADPPPRYVLDAIMTNMLIIDKPDYAEGLDWLSQVWRNWERDEREAKARQQDTGWTEIGTTTYGARLSIAPAGTPPPQVSSCDECAKGGTRHPHVAIDG